nr:MAG TPA: hypothetical protein [Caudoviricetes sp.]
MRLLSKIETWRQKQLRKRVVLKLLSNPNHKPDRGETSDLVDKIISYINNDDHFSACN